MKPVQPNKTTVFKLNVLAAFCLLTSGTHAVASDKVPSYDNTASTPESVSKTAEAASGAPKKGKHKKDADSASSKSTPAGDSAAKPEAATPASTSTTPASTSGSTPASTSTSTSTSAATSTTTTVPASSDPSGQPASALPGGDETNTDKYLSQRKLFADACTRICKLLREGNYDGAVYLSRSTADDLQEHKVDGSDPFPRRGADVLKILKDCGMDTDALDRSFQKEAKAAEQKGEIPRAQIFYALVDQLENGGSPIPVAKPVTVSESTYDDGIRLEMKLLHIVVKKYGREHNGKYPVTLDATFKKYFPTITLNNTKSVGPFYNPFTKRQDWFEVKPIDDLNQVTDTKAIPKGKIWYWPLKNGADYAIMAGGHDDRPIRDKAGKLLVISRYFVDDPKAKIELPTAKTIIQQATQAAPPKSDK